LYYSDEETRPVVSMLHWIIGLGAPAALIWHIVRGRGTRSTSDRHLTATEKLETSEDLVGPR
jgi:hypothetical protein